MKLAKITLSAVLAASFLHADDAADIAALKAQLAELTKQVSELKTQQQSANVGALNNQIKELKVKTGGDNIKWSADFRTEWDNINYKMAGRTGGFNNNGFVFPSSDPVFGSLPSNYNKPTLFTERLILGMAAAPTKDLSFVGKLSMQKAFGATANNMQNNNPFSYSTFDWINNEQAMNNGIRVKEAYAIYFNEAYNVPYTASIGRRPSTDGLPINLSEGNKDANSPLAHLINVEYDGASILTNWEKVTGVPGMSLKFCAGNGLTNAAAWGNGNVPNYANQNNMNGDVSLWGMIFVPYDDGQYSVHSMWFNAYNVIGYTQNAYTAYSNAYGQYYSQTYAGMTGAGGNYNSATGWNNLQYNQNNMQFTNVGNLQGGTVMAMMNGIGNNWSDFLDRTILFGSFAFTQTQPSATATNMNGQAMATGQLASGNGMLGSAQSKYGSSWWFGINMPALVTSDGKIGLEYNQGSKYWRPITYGEDNFAGSRLATRGQAYSAYYDQPLLKNLSLMASYSLMNYDYAGSNAFFGYEGTPWTQSEALAQNMNFMKSAQDIRVFLRYRY